MSTSESLLRHAVATLAYRSEKVLRDVPAGFPHFTPSPATRDALAVVAHMGDLMEWAARIARGGKEWVPVPQDTWEGAVDRFFAGLADLDAAIAGIPDDSRRHAILMQAPIADALTHVGQLAMMRGICGAPIRAESYGRAKISIGRVGRDQDAVRAEFDEDASPQKPRR